MTTLKYLILGISFITTFAACTDDTNSVPAITNSATFEVTIENNLEAKTYMDAGETGLLMPGESLQFSFNAGTGSYLSFATMFVQTNDLFYAPDASGLALYNNGNAVTGDITTQISLWDAGTEVNEEPGVGPNQAPRQSGPDIGMDENGTIELIENIADGFTYPAVADIIKVTMDHNGGTMFTVTIENVSGSSSLPSPLAPGVWVVHNDQVQLFEEGQAASAGLEDIAEDGDNTILSDNLSSNSGYSSPLAPGVWAVHNNGVTPIFEDGQADRGVGLEALAEDGVPSALNDALTGAIGVSENGIFNTPQGASSPGPLLPGNSYTFTFTASEGDYLSFATMLVQTNDLFYSPDDVGISLFNNGEAISGDITGQISLWDAGTEVNEFPGAGNNQPLRGGVDSGPAENGVVEVVNDGFTYPSVSEAIRVTITPQ